MQCIDSTAPRSCSATRAPAGALSGAAPAPTDVATHSRAPAPRESKVLRMDDSLVFCRPRGDFTVTWTLSNSFRTAAEHFVHWLFSRTPNARYCFHNDDRGKDSARRNQKGPPRGPFRRDTLWQCLG